MGAADDTGSRTGSDPGEGAEPIDDVGRAAEPGDPPAPGAQWDEVHGRWERWDEATGEWAIVGDDVGDGVAPAAENPLPPFLARELRLAEDLEAVHTEVADVDRASPSGPAPRGAQWNEVEGRWERWDEGAAAWVEATVEPESPEQTDQVRGTSA